MSPRRADVTYCKRRSTLSDFGPNTISVCAIRRRTNSGSGTVASVIYKKVIGPCDKGLLGRQICFPHQNPPDCFVH